MSVAIHTIAPSWLATLVEDVLIECVTPMGFVGCLGYRYWEPGSADNPSAAWLVVAYPAPNEIRGQCPNDGTVFVSGFQFDVTRLTRAMSTVEEVIWRSPTGQVKNLDGPELRVTGTFIGIPVRIRFFSIPPEDEPPAFYVDPGTSEVTPLA